MTNLLLPLLVMACALMMIFMMRGMHGRRNTRSADHDPKQARAQGQLPETLTVDALTVDARIAELEREFASLGDVPDPQSGERGNGA